MIAILEATRTEWSREQWELQFFHLIAPECRESVAGRAVGRHLPERHCPVAVEPGLEQAGAAVMPSEASDFLQGCAQDSSLHTARGTTNNEKVKNALGATHGSPSLMKLSVHMLLYLYVAV